MAAGSAHDSGDTSPNCGAGDGPSTSAIGANSGCSDPDAHAVYANVPPGSSNLRTSVI